MKYDVNHIMQLNYGIWTFQGGLYIDWTRRASNTITYFSALQSAALDGYFFSPEGIPHTIKIEIINMFVDMFKTISFSNAEICKKNIDLFLTKHQKLSAFS